MTPRSSRKNQPLTNDFLSSLSKPSQNDLQNGFGSRTMYPNLNDRGGEENASPNGNLS